MPTLEEKVEKIEKDVARLKLAMIGHSAKKKRVSMRNLLKGMRIEEKEIRAAKKSLFKNIK